MRKGIVLAGGTGSRLWPSTLATSKQLLPVYDKPMIYYPVSTLLLAGIRDILIITTPEDAARFQALLGDGTRLNVNFTYAVQPEPGGLAQSMLIGADFLGGAASALILGDNLFFGNGLSEMLHDAGKRTDGATVFAYHVNDPQRYGVVEFDGIGRALSIEEKPQAPRSSYAIVGLYFYDGTAVDRARALRPSARGELEITDLNRTYLADGDLDVKIFGRGMAWLDTGTHDDLLAASNFVAAIESRQGLKIGSLEETAFKMGYIGAAELERLAGRMGNSSYGRYLLGLLDDGSPPTDRAPAATGNRGS